LGGRSSSGSDNLPKLLQIENWKVNQPLLHPTPSLPEGNFYSSTSLNKAPLFYLLPKTHFFATKKSAYFGQLFGTICRFAHQN
jgi:hypothetical protein